MYTLYAAYTLLNLYLEMRTPIGFPKINCHRAQGTASAVALREPDSNTVIICMLE
jgi:hypothetical protein